MTLTQIEKYRYKKYNKNYLAVFEKEKKNLNSIKKIEIEHIGSTAVKGLGGKGIIDIMIGINIKDIKNISKAIQRKGFILINKEKDRWFFEKDYLYQSVKRIHIQLVKINNKIWKNAIAFRDYLIKDKKARQKYAKIKKTASRLARGDGFLYRKHKNSFINNILEKDIKQLKKIK